MQRAGERVREAVLGGDLLERDHVRGAVLSRPRWHRLDGGHP